MASETSLPLFSGAALDLGVNLLQVGRLAAKRRAIIDDLDLQFLGRLIDDGHNLVCPGLPLELVGDRVERRARQIFPGASHREKEDPARFVDPPNLLVGGERDDRRFPELDLVGVMGDPEQISAGGTPPRCLRPGRRAVGSPTCSPSVSAINVPATPGRRQACCTSSTGVQWSLPGCSNKAARSGAGAGPADTGAIGLTGLTGRGLIPPAIGAAKGAEGGAGRGARTAGGIEDALASGMAATGSAGAAAGAVGVAMAGCLPVNSSGIVSAIWTFLCVTGFLSAMNNGAITCKGMGSGAGPV